MEAESVRPIRASLPQLAHPLKLRINLSKL
jgi:hypothetical protein